MWGLAVSVPDHCLSQYFQYLIWFMDYGVLALISHFSIFKIGLQLLQFLKGNGSETVEV